MRVLVVGGGGREHALAWKIASSPKVEAVLAAPGSDAIAAFATCFPEIKATDVDALIQLARAERDRPGRDRARRSRSPRASRIDCAKPTFRPLGPRRSPPNSNPASLSRSTSWPGTGFRLPAFREFSNLGAARSYVRELGGACVVKADGLAAGKGVAVCSTPDEAERALVEIMEDRRFGDAGSAVVVEERLEGDEVSYYAITDGEHIATLAPARDHKRALDGDQGRKHGWDGRLLSGRVDHRIDRAENRYRDRRAHSPRNGRGGPSFYRRALRRSDGRC